jgi:hypothetical protein
MSKNPVNSPRPSLFKTATFKVMVNWPGDVPRVGVTLNQFTPGGVVLPLVIVKLWAAPRLLRLIIWAPGSDVPPSVYGSNVTTFALVVTHVGGAVIVRSTSMVCGTWVVLMGMTLTFDRYVPGTKLAALTPTLRVEGVVQQGVAWIDRFGIGGRLNLLVNNVAGGALETEVVKVSGDILKEPMLIGTEGGILPSV